MKEIFYQTLYLKNLWRKKKSMFEKVYVPPIKIQGIKTKLVALISQTAYLEEHAVLV